MVSRKRCLRNNDKEQHPNLEEAQHVLESEAPLRSDSVDQQGKGHDTDTDCSLVPATNVHICCVEEHLACVRGSVVAPLVSLAPLRRGTIRAWIAPPRPIREDSLSDIPV